MKPKVIAFIGIDGAGKTTVIREVKQRLTEKGTQCSLEYMGLGRNYNVPALGNLLAFYSRVKYRKEKKGDKSPSVRDNYRIRSFMWVCVQYAELWMRYIRLRWSRNVDYVLCDRYFYDGLILSNPRTYRIFKRLTPVPFKSFLVYAHPEIIVRRKNEATEGNVADFYNRVEKLKGHFSISVIDNNRSLAAVVDDVLEEIGKC